MRSTIAMILGMAVALPACGKGEHAGQEAAKMQAEKEQKEKPGAAEVAKTIRPPVPNKAHLPCSQVLDPTTITQALGEAQPVTIQDSKSEPEAAADCSVVRGGKRLTEAEQKAMIKKEGKLGVMPGDELCNIATFCWTIEDADHFKKRCLEDKEQLDDSLGFSSCILVVATGADDVKRFRFFDDDTKCIIQVRGGPSNVDNDLIGKCAKAAHDLIGPLQIAVPAEGAAAPAPAAPAAPAGSGSGS
jgi:hypothetical protein